jgi:toxin ParE1/3/4
VRRLSYLFSADDDIRDILHYVAAESTSVDIALSFVSRLQDHCQLLADLPGTLGIARHELQPDLCSTAAHGYLIFFRYTKDAVQIVNVLHASRDILAYFNEH